MGTSKGYIAPTSPHWSKAKREVSLYVGKPTKENKKKAAADYASAMIKDDYSIGSVSKIFSNIFHFIAFASTNGVDRAMEEFGCKELLEKNGFYANLYNSQFDKIEEN